MFRKMNALLPLTLLILASLPAQAKDMSYAFIEASANIGTDVDADLIGLSASGNGYGIAGSWLMGPVAYSEWRYDYHNLDANTEGQEASARFGAHHRLNQFQYGKLDVYGGLSLDYAKFEIKNNVNTELLDAYGVGGYLGLLHGPNHHFEYGAEVGVGSMEDVSDFYGLHAQWNVTHAMALRASYRSTYYAIDGKPDVESSSFKIAARVTFGSP